MSDDTVGVISLIGTGGGYGESVVVHLGNKQWIVVDSCCNPKSGSCLPLDYLREIGVDMKNDVKMIICTHWHDDHIQGISQLLKACEEAIFCMSITSSQEDFMDFVELDSSKGKGERTISSTNEMKECLQIISARKKQVIKKANQDRLLFSHSQDGIDGQIYALSPSDFMMDEFARELSFLIDDTIKNPNKKAVIQSPNNKSIALFITINNHYILLGSDLEYTSDNRKGWQCVIDNCQCIKHKKASLIKIPHHGSSTGYHKNLWNNLMQNDAIAKLTPWSRNTKLPTKEMLQIYLSHTPNLYITSEATISRKSKIRDHNTTKTIKKFNNTLQEVKFNYGRVTSTIDALDHDAKWSVYLEGSAVPINEDHCS